MKIHILKVKKWPAKNITHLLSSQLAIAIGNTARELWGLLPKPAAFNIGTTPTETWGLPKKHSKKPNWGSVRKLCHVIYCIV